MTIILAYLTMSLRRSKDTIQDLRKHSALCQTTFLQRVQQRGLKCLGNLDDLICQNEILSMTATAGSVAFVHIDRISFSFLFLFPVRRGVQHHNLTRFLGVRNKGHQGTSLDACVTALIIKRRARWRTYKSIARISVGNEGRRADWIRRIVLFVDTMS
jgi:hypothetical protein